MASRSRFRSSHSRPAPVGGPRSARSLHSRLFARAGDSSLVLPRSSRSFSMAE